MDIVYKSICEEIILPSRYDSDLVYIDINELKIHFDPQYVEFIAIDEPVAFTIYLRKEPSMDMLNSINLSI